MRLDEPEIAIAASPREWAQGLHRHLADHGGARVRLTVMDAAAALSEAYDVLVADDTSSFLTRGLVEDLRRAGRGVLGVYDADEPAGKDALVEVGIDDMIVRSASPEEFVAAIAGLTATLQRPPEGSQREPDTAAPVATGHAAPGDPLTGLPAPPRAPLVTVAGPPGGCGVTEVAIGIAATLAARALTPVLVDADEVAPALAQRLGLPPYPNLRAAADALEGDAADAQASVQCEQRTGLRVVPGLVSPDGLTPLRPAELRRLLSGLAAHSTTVVVNAGARLEQLGGGLAGGPPRYGQSRTAVADADVLMGVSRAEPVALSRLLAWCVQLRALNPSAPLHLALNHAPAAPFRRAEAAAALEELGAASVVFVPTDRRVAAAAWSGTIPERGPLARSVAALAECALSVPAPSRGPRRRRGAVRRR